MRALLAAATQKSSSFMRRIVTWAHTNPRFKVHARNYAHHFLLGRCVHKLLYRINHDFDNPKTSAFALVCVLIKFYQPTDQLPLAESSPKLPLRLNFSRGKHLLGTKCHNEIPYNKQNVVRAPNHEFTRPSRNHHGDEPENNHQHADANILINCP